MATRANIQTGTVVAPRAGAESPGPGFYVRQIVRYVLMAVVTLLLLGPFILAFFGSFKTTAEVLAWPPTLLPTQVRLENYNDVWNVLKDSSGNSYLPRWLFNSAFLSAVVVLTQLFFCSLAAYAFARLRFPGREARVIQPAQLRSWRPLRALRFELMPLHGKELASCTAP